MWLAIDFSFSIPLRIYLIEGEALMNGQGGLIFFVYYMKNCEKGGQIFRLLHEKQWAGWTTFHKTITGILLLFYLGTYYSWAVGTEKGKTIDLRPPQPHKTDFGR